MGQGGAEQVVIDLCQNTSKVFDKIIVLSTGGVNVNTLEDLGVIHIVIPDLNSKKINEICITIKIILKVVKDYKIDIIHSHHRMAAFYAQIIRLFFKNIRLIYTAHNIFKDKCWLTKISLSNTEIIAVGQGVRKNLIEYFKINKNKITVINNSVKQGDLSKYSRPKECDFNKTIISCIGRLSEQKGIDYFIKAISEVKKRSVDFKLKVLIIGDGELRKDLEELVYKLNLYEDVEFLGYRSNVCEYIRYSDFIVSSSLWEGFPLTPIECFASGKTVIATNITGNNEIIIDSYNGLLVEPRDVNALAESIIKLCNNPTLLSYLEVNALSSYNEKYSYKEYINNYIEAYKFS